VPNTGVGSLQVIFAILPPFFPALFKVHHLVVLTLPLSQLTGLKIFQNGVAGIDIVAPLANGFMITSCLAFQNKMYIPADPQSLVANNLFK
jgi:hypothetical protein